MLLLLGCGEVVCGRVIGGAGVVIIVTAEFLLDCENGSSIRWQLIAMIVPNGCICAITGIIMKELLLVAVDSLLSATVFALM